MKNDDAMPSGETESAAQGEHVTVQVDLSAFFVNQYGGWAAFRSSDVSDTWTYTKNGPAQHSYSHGPKWIKFFFPIAGTTYADWTIDPSCTPDGHFYNQASLSGPPSPGPTPPWPGFESDYFRTASASVKVNFYVQRTGDRFTLIASYSGIDTAQHRSETDE